MLTYPNLPTETRSGILSAVYDALAPTSLSLRQPSHSEYARAGYFDEHGGGVLRETETGDMGFGYFQIDSYTLLVGRDACVRTDDRDDEKCPAPTYAEFAVSARTKRLLEHAVGALGEWHSARGAQLVSRR